jgi:hypothetical protein
MKTLAVAVFVSCLCLTVSAATFQLNGDVYEVLYAGSSADDRAKIGSFGPLPFDANEPQELRTVVEKFVEIARKTAAPGRPELTFMLAGARRAGVRTFIMYTMSGGGKGTKRESIESIEAQTLDPSRVYPLLPLLSGYKCAVANLGFRNGQWVLRDEQDVNPVPGFRCAPKVEPSDGKSNWTVQVVVKASQLGELADRDKRAIEQLPDSIYDAMEALKPKYAILRTSRDEDRAEKEFLARTPPMAQVGYARRLDFVIEVRLAR